MAILPFPDAVRDLLRQPNPAVVATLRSDGQPVSVATWYLLEDDDRVLLNMDHTRVRLNHLRADPRVSLTVLAADNWYTHVSLLGTVVEFKDDEDLTDIDRLSTHYGGSPYPDRESPRVSAWMRVDRWHGWGAARTD
ncbi:PPOX class F420-dependent oxidoreductase [Nocardioides sp. cx-173]|uniref:PPOX class F420-dependent oxidoreductase n=1 Tax=Nocardioides sp. cx-173 TaxID=2898796 RepID=UPI001E32D259|nr:PPOX class F420-dependent oxidoreductase [Nocardioides sp. cx-173]MCD4526078.1 PPOX class F420-dependent oxidoreductase [Nocardioides sp. cx-173]UGB43770.1 PPOX class F420-dependent oxidoreductase [Nocardioides sp. cx-173]